LGSGSSRVLLRDRIQLRGRDEIAGDRLFCYGVGQLRSGEQAGEISLALRRSGHDSGGKRRTTAPKAGCPAGEEKERLILFDRPAERSAVLIALQSIVGSGEKFRAFK